MGDCLKALQEAKGDMKTPSSSSASAHGPPRRAKLSAVPQTGGAVGTQKIHAAGGKIGVLLEPQLRVRFRSPHRRLPGVALRHRDAHRRRRRLRGAVSRDDVTAADLEREKDVYRAWSAATGGKPRQSHREDARGQARQVQRRVLPPRSAVHQGNFRRPSAQLIAFEGRKARRKHQRLAASPASK